MTYEETHRLNTLIEKYLSAQTSSAEEAEMRRLLSSSGLLPEHENFRSMLMGIDSLRAPEGLEERIAAGIDRLAALENTHTVKVRRTARWWGVAASVALLIGIGTAFLGRTTREHPGSDLTPEETYAQMEDALTLLATSMDRGYREAAQAEETTAMATATALRALASLSESNEHTENI